MTQQLVFAHLVGHNSRILLLAGLRCRWRCGYQRFPSHVTHKSNGICSVSPMFFVLVLSREAYRKRVGRVRWLGHEGGSFVSILNDVRLISEGWVRAVQIGDGVLVGYLLVEKSFDADVFSGQHECLSFDFAGRRLRRALLNHYKII